MTTLFLFRENSLLRHRCAAASSGFLSRRRWRMVKFSTSQFPENLFQHSLQDVSILAAKPEATYETARPVLPRQRRRRA